MNRTQIIFVPEDGADPILKGRIEARIRANASRSWRPCDCEHRWLKIVVGGDWQSGQTDEIEINACCLDRLARTAEGLRMLDNDVAVPSGFTQRARLFMRREAA